jgi:hypothetical protein
LRPLLIAFCFALSASAAVAAQKQPVGPPKPVTPPKRADANAQTAAIPGLPPRLRLIEGPAINGKKEKLEGDLTVNLGPSGQQVIRSGYDMLKAFDSTGRRLWSLDIGRQGEVGDVAAIGWRGSQVWVSDRRFSQIALLENGVVTRSLELPTWVRPTWTNRKSFPVFGSLDVYALMNDGSMIVVPQRPHAIVGTVGYDTTMQYVVHVTENGIIDRPITKLASYDFVLRAAMRRAYSDRTDDKPGRWPLPAEYWPRLRVSPDGMRTVTVTVDTTHAGSDTIVVAALNEKGGPVYVRKFGFQRKTYTETEIDSIALARFPRLSPVDRANRAKYMTRSLASVRDVTLGHDYSVWITMREVDGAKAVVGIDPGGQFVGTIYLPRTFWLKAADRNTLWIVDYRTTFRDVVRYTTAKP